MDNKFFTRKSKKENKKLAKKQIEPISNESIIPKIIKYELFDLVYYQSQTNEKFKNVNDAILHFIQKGYKEQLNPHYFFNCIFYLKNNLDVAKLNINPLVHFIEFGANEKRNPHPLIDLNFILQQNASIKDNAEIISYFYKNCNQKRINPHPLFDTNFYLIENPDVGESKINALLHFLIFGRIEMRNPHPLFDMAYYFSYDKNLDPSRINPLIHYVENINKYSNHHPNPFFNSSEYYSNNPDVKKGMVNPLVHYIHSGHKEGRSASELLDQLIKSSQATSVNFLERDNWRGKNVLITSHDASRTGAPLIILKIVEELVNKYHLNCTILLLEGGPLIEEFKKFGNVIYFPGIWQSASGSVAGVRQYIFELLKSEYLFALCNSAQSHSIVKMLHNFNLPVYSLVHEFADPYEKVAFTHLMNFSKKVIFPAELVQKAAFKKIEKEIQGTEIIPQGLLDPEFPKVTREEARKAVTKEFGLAEDTFIFFGCGYVDMRKGCDLFVQAAIKFLEKSPESNVAFIWMGQFDLIGGSSTYKQWVFQDIVTAGYEDKILFIGGRDNVDKYYVAADTFLMLSRHDPFPCVVHEAMAAGLPIILFEDATGSIEAINDKGGFAAPYLDIETVTEKMIQLYSSSELKHKMSEYNIKRIEKDYRFEDYVEKLMDVITSDLKIENLGRQIPTAISEAKKIIIPCSDWWISGVNNLIEAIGLSLIERGWDFEILFTNTESHVLKTAKRLVVDKKSSPTKKATDMIEPAEPQYEIQLPKVPFGFLPVDDGFSLKNRWISLINYIENNAPCIYLTGYDYVANAISPALSDKVGVVGWNHADDNEYYEQAHRLGRYWNAQVCVSKQIQSEINKINPAYEKRNYHIANSTIEQKEIISDKEPPKKIIRIIYTGRIVQYQKRILDFIDFVNSLDSADVAYELYIVGEDQDGSKKILEEKLKDQIAENKVILTGRLFKNEIFDLLKESHFFVLLSDFEGMPISLIEAMSQGCIPIVPEMKSGIPEIIKNGENGFIMESRNYNEWVEVITSVGLDKKEYSKISERVTDTIRQNYTVEKVSEDFSNLFEKVLSEIIENKYDRPEVLKWNNKTGDVLPPQNINI